MMGRALFNGTRFHIVRKRLRFAMVLDAGH
jgi:hypothetical protein